MCLLRSNGLVEAFQWRLRRGSLIVSWLLLQVEASSKKFSAGDGPTIISPDPPFANRILTGCTVFDIEPNR